MHFGFQNNQVCPESNILNEILKRSWKTVVQRHSNGRCEVAPAGLLASTVLTFNFVAKVVPAINYVNGTLM